MSDTDFAEGHGPHKWVWGAGLIALLAVIAVITAVTRGASPTPSPTGLISGPSTSSTSTTPPPTSSSSSTAPSPSTSSSTSTASGPIRPAVPGPMVEAAKFDKAPTIDGSGSDWDGHTTYTSDKLVDGSKPSISATWRLGWDSKNYYVYAVVKDKQITQIRELRPWLIDRGDSISFELGTFSDEVRTDKLPKTDVRVLIGPTETGGLLRALMTADGDTFKPGPAFTAGSAVVKRTSSGYTVEAAIPWSVLNVKPKDGLVLATNLVASDAIATGSKRGRLAAMISNNSQRRNENVKFRFLWGQLKLTD